MEDIERDQVSAINVIRLDDDDWIRCDILVFLNVTPKNISNNYYDSFTCLFNF